MDVEDKECKNFTNERVVEATVERKQMVMQEWIIFFTVTDIRVTRWMMYIDRQKQASSNLLLPPTLWLTPYWSWQNEYWESPNLTANQGLSQRVNQHLTTCRQIPWLGAMGAQGCNSKPNPLISRLLLTSYEAHLICSIDTDQRPVLDFVNEDLKKDWGAGVDLGYEPKVTAGTIMQQNVRVVSVCIIKTT